MSAVTANGQTNLDGVFYAPAIGAVGYRFDGSTMYATMPAFISLGDPSTYTSVAYGAGDDGYLINEFGIAIGTSVSEFGRVGANYHASTVTSLTITDSAPIQDTTIQEGNGALYGTLSPLTLPGAFVIEFDWIRKDGAAGAVNNQTLLADNVGDDDTIRVYDTAHATLAGKLSIAGSSNSTTVAGFESVADGQHVHCKIARTAGGTLSVEIDGTEVHSDSSTLGTLTIDTVYIDSNRSTRPLRAGSGMQNLEITDLDGGEHYLWTMDEGSGTTSLNTGETAGFDITWTAANWTEIPSNSRHYAMDEQGGYTLYDSIGGHHAEIQNFSDDSWRPTDVLSFSPVFDDPFDLITTDSAKYFHLIVAGDYAYAARGTGGFAIFDIRDPSAVSLVAEDKTSGYGSWRYSYVLLIGTTLYCFIRYNVGADPIGGGAIEKWDVTDPANPVKLADEYRAENTEDPISVNYIRCHAGVYDGEYLYVAGQRQGAYKFDPNDLASGPIASNEDWTTDYLDGGNEWETQGLCLYGDYVVFANYVHGIRIVDKATLNAVDIQVDVLVNTEQLRPWDCKMKGDTLLVSANTSAGNSVNQGLLTMDLSVLPATPEWGTFHGFPAADAAGGTPAGDEPDTIIDVYEDYAYIAHGLAGVLVYDVSVPSQPVYKGLHENLNGADNVFAVTAFGKDTSRYVLYADGPNPSGSGSKSVYIDELQHT